MFILTGGPILSQFFKDANQDTVHAIYHAVSLRAIGGILRAFNVKQLIKMRQDKMGKFCPIICQNDFRASMVGNNISKYKLSHVRGA